MTGGPRDLPETKPRRRPQPYDDSDDGTRELPETYDRSAFYRGPDDPDHEDEEDGL